MADHIRLSTPHYERDEESTYSMAQSAPGPFVKNGDFLRLNASSLNASCTLQLNARLLTEGGEIIPLGVAMPITGTGDQTAVVVPLVNGWLLGWIVFVSAGTVTAGQVFTSVEIQQGVGTPATRLIGLGNGEVTNARNLGPGSSAITPPTVLALNPTPTVSTVANPAAGAQWTATVPAATTWEILSIHAHLVLAVAAGNRIIELNVSSGGNKLAVIPGDTGLIPLSILDFLWSPNLVYLFKGGVIGNIVLQEFAPRSLPAGTTIVSSGFNFDAADQWSQIVITVVARPS